MPNWAPPPEMEILIAQAIEGRKEGMLARQHREKEALDADLASRGMLQSGMRVTGHYDIDSATFNEIALLVVDDVLEITRAVYGQIPIEAIPWIREHIERWLDGMSRSLTQVATELRSRARIDGAAEPMTGPVVAAKRKLSRELGTLKIKAMLKELTPPARVVGSGADVFICHASEDKAAVARPLADALTAKGYKVWLDETELAIGDRLLDEIDEGLAGCRFGVVILSPRFFGKKWTRRELAGLVAREDAEDRTVILPVWVDVDQATIASHLPSLAGILAARMAEGLDRVVEQIEHAMGKHR